MVRFLYGMTVICYFGFSFLLHPRRTYREALQKYGGKYDAIVHIDMAAWCLATVIEIILVIIRLAVGALTIMDWVLLDSLYVYIPLSVIVMIVFGVCVSKVEEKMKNDK